jgi:TIR domain-containing protein
MKTLWITYSWEDNKNGDVEFIAQELEKVGINVKLDRWNIQAGKRLWEQIDNFITNQEECEAWAIIATQNSLGSEPCKEEVAYALDRALNSRGQTFPLIGIFTASVDKELIPSAIKTRLYVSLKDTDWIERIKSSLENRAPNIPKPLLEPYTVDFRKTVNGKNVIEIRPRAGTWAPFFCAIPIAEKEKVSPYILRGAKGNIPMAGSLSASGNEESTDKNWWIMFAGDEATPTISYFLFCNDLPSKFYFGVYNSQPQFLVTVS